MKWESIWKKESCYPGVCLDGLQTTDFPAELQTNRNPERYSSAVLVERFITVASGEA
jgi:hypothetical protein